MFFSRPFTFSSRNCLCIGSWNGWIRARTADGGTLSPQHGRAGGAHRRGTLSIFLSIYLCIGSYKLYFFPIF